ncbi:MAG: GNAT family N-acetyltransferase [candidate division Zixibacteria bacterium]|nr:GNAT family N-acetyltransferase [candidate division Zixibacteria bacterium]
MPDFRIRLIENSDYDWITKLLTNEWGSVEVVTRGVIHHTDKLLGFIAEYKSQLVGLVTFNIKDKNCEIVTLNSHLEGKGIGTALIDAVKTVACSNNCKRLWLITTNDNTTAMRFYQKRGFELVAVHRNALEHSRKLKPSIPLAGIDNIPLRDEIEMEMAL